MASEQAERPAAAASTEAAGEFFDHQTGPFFRRADWGAFWITFGISMVAYFHTLAPTVTLEDSGELAVASDYLGVPHPPGYPIWTLLTWFFQWIFHWVKYFGQPDSNWMLVLRSLKDVFDPTMTGYPNPAWSVGLCSAFFGALACGLLALLVSRSGSDILRSLRRETEVLGLQTESRICLICGVTGGLLFAFSSVLWSQSTIVEVYSLNAFFMVLTLLLTYRWMCRPHEDKTLYTVAFVFGLGLTNHQTLVFLGPAMLAAMWFRDRELFRDAIGALLVLVAGLLFKKAMDINPAGASPTLLEHKQTLYIGGLVCLALLVGVFLVQRQLFTAWKRLSIAGGLAFLGVSFYFGYLPVSSEQNPPMNWGYPRTVEGFWHAVSRGQYEKISPVDNLKDALTKNPTKYPRLCWKIIFEPGEYTSVVAQFTFWLCLPALLIPFFVARMSHKARDWLLISAIAFVFLTFVFIIFQYPTLDVQQLFIGRVQYIQAHAILAVWISYGLIFALAWIDTRTGGNPAVKFAGSAFVALLPLVPVGINAYDQKFINLVGGSEQNSHDFGWQFGAWQLEGARAILHDIGPEEAKSYPNPAYPPPMDTNAVFFGGTDPGRFVPTYMIYSAHFREDVYLITQNALADNTYMNVMRDLYGDRIWIPSQQDSNFAFQKYVQDVQSGKIPAGAEVSFEGGRVSVQGVAGVMMINGILARMIYEANKLQHSFYVEESYVIPWMYEFLEPHGLIMKINKEPVKITPEMVKNDREFWDWYTKRLTSNPRFHRDVVARKTFSKLRSAIAGIYAARRMYADAEHAFSQAIQLYPLSPEANFRLADIYLQQFQFAKGREVIEEFLTLDKENDKVRDFLKQIKDTEQLDTRRRELEGALAKGGQIDAAMELADIYRRMNLMGPFDGLCNSIINQAGIPLNYLMQIAQMYADLKRLDMVVTVFRKVLEREPGNARIWVDLAAVHVFMQQANEAMDALRKGVEVGGEPVRDMVRRDQRFAPLRQLPAFNALIPPVQAGNLNLNMGLPELGGF
jgi:hypothetical protein